MIFSDLDYSLDYTAKDFYMEFFGYPNWSIQYQIVKTMLYLLCIFNLI